MDPAEMEGNVRRETVAFTDSDEDLCMKKYLDVSKSANDYPEAFVHAIRYSAVKSLLTSSSRSSLSYSNSRYSFKSDSETYLRHQIFNHTFSRLSKTCSSTQANINWPTNNLVTRYCAKRK